MRSARTRRATTGRVRVYTRERCHLCHSVTTVLRSRGMAFDEVRLEYSTRGVEQLRRATGRDTFPQVVIDGRPVGGFDELVALAHSGRLEMLPPDAA